MAEPIGWFTVNGVHVPIFDGQSKSDAYKKYINSKHGKDVARLSSRSDKPKDYKGEMKEEGSKRYFENEDGSTIEYLTTKEYDKICEDFNNSLTDEDREIIEAYITSPMAGQSSNLNKQMSEDDEKMQNIGINKDPKNVMTEYERDSILRKEYDKLSDDVKNDSYKLERAAEEAGYAPNAFNHINDKYDPNTFYPNTYDAYINDSKFIEHNKELYDLRMREHAEMKAIRNKYASYDDMYNSPDFAKYQAIDKKYSELIDKKSQEYGLGKNKSEYFYRANMEYATLKSAYLKQDKLEYVTPYRMIDNIRKGKIEGLSESTLNQYKGAIDYQDKLDNIFKTKGITLDKDIIIYRRTHENADTIKNGFTKYGYTSTTAKSTLAKKMPSGASFGSSQIEIIIPKGTKILPLKGVVKHKYNAIKHKDASDIKNERWLGSQAEILLPRETSYKYVSTTKGKYLGYDKGYDYRYTVVADTSKSKNDFKYKSKKKVNGEWIYEY